MPKLQAIQVGVAKAHAFGKGPIPEQLPITPAILRAIKTVWSSSTPYTKGRFIPKFWLALQAAGLVGPNFAGHSFRIGAATTAAELGIEDSTIKALGRWHSSAFLAYVRMPSEHLATISRTLSTTPPREQA